MSKALYRKYRSTSLDEVVGQEHITRLLKRALASDRVAHAYLFTGPRGVGKTSIARIMAYEINKLPYSEDAHHLDIIEIDAASNNGVEDVRDLREKVQIAPVSAAKKVYIIDEVHMLSKPAFNALLKTLEEPPAHVVFILATTDVNKLPATIISRTQHYGFRTIPTDVAAAHLGTIAKAEGIAIDEAALRLVAERGGGSFRDSISLLDQVANLHTDDSAAITSTLIEDTLGLASHKHLEALLVATQSGDIAALAKQVDAVEDEGINPVDLTNQLIMFVKQKVAAHPEFLPLLDALLDVPRSSHPSIKLLSVLARYNSTPVQPVQQSAPSVEPVTKTPAAKSKNVALAAPIPEVSASVESLKQLEDEPAEAQKKTAKRTEGTTDFDWTVFVEHLREHHVAVYSVLSKCTPEVNGSELKLYTTSAFYKKKLDETKYSSSLHESLSALGMPELDIITVPERAPIKDSQASAIADIMGGGVEVAV